MFALAFEVFSRSHPSSYACHAHHSSLSPPPKCPAHSGLHARVRDAA